MSTPASSGNARATSQIVTLPPVPELFDVGFLDVLIPATQSGPRSDAAAMGVASAMTDTPSSATHQKLTTNDAPAFSSTLVPTLNAYLGLRTGISGEQIDCYLEKAWAVDPNLTLRIIWNTRSIHDGKGEKEFFYRAFGWLLDNHPRTAITNLHCLVDPVCGSEKRSDAEKKEQGASHGYWKDLLNILALATLDQLRPKSQLAPHSTFLHNRDDGKSRPAFKNNQEQKEWSRAQRLERSRRAHDLLAQKLLDNHYRALYIAVARLIAGQLVKEADVMDKITALPANANKDERRALMRALTLASKWAPTPGGSHDRVTNISSAICLLLHEAQVPCVASHQIPFSFATSLPASDMHLLRNIYQKSILTRGRQYTGIPEPLMSANSWSKIEYSRVASVSMNKNKEKFFMHDESRFLDYLQDVESGKKQISGATLLPHVLAMEAKELYTAQQGSEYGDTTRSLASVRRERQRELAAAQMRVVDAQWAKLVARLRESGQLDNCIAICDVSGSMGYISNTTGRKTPFDVDPIWPSIALSLLVARLAKPPFNDMFITFSASPELVTVDPESSGVSLGATVSRMGGANFGYNTDFNAVFLDLILPLAIKHKVPKDQMIKRLFVFSDMEFDQANTQTSTYWQELSEATDDSTEEDTSDWEDGAMDVTTDDAAEANADTDDIMVITATEESTAAGATLEDAFIANATTEDTTIASAAPEDAALTDSDLAAKWKTNHDVVMEAYAQAGYDVPEMVYWNLSDPRDGNDITTPVTGDRKGVALLSGYSPSTLKVFMDVDKEEWEVLDEGGEPKTEKASSTPEEFMKKALGRKSYDGLVVVD